MLLLAAATTVSSWNCVLTDAAYLLMRWIHLAKHTIGNLLRAICMRIEPIIHAPDKVRSDSRNAPLVAPRPRIRRYMRDLSAQQIPGTYDQYNRQPPHIEDKIRLSGCLHEAFCRK